jgi:hypothetical protein
MISNPQKTKPGLQDSTRLPLGFLILPNLAILAEKNILT